MILVDGEKYACQQCIRGHRSSTCKHIQRPLVLVRSRGRPLTDSSQRIAIFAEEITDEDEKKIALKQEDNPKNNIMAAKLISENVKQEDIESKAGVTKNECCNSKPKVSCCSGDGPTKSKSPSSSADDIARPKKSCCSSKMEKVTKPKSKNNCSCCSTTKCERISGPIYVLKAAKRQVYNVEKDSLKLLDPVMEIPNSKVGLDLIKKVSKSKQMQSCRNKQLKEELQKFMQDNSSCSLRAPWACAKPDTSETSTTLEDGSMMMQFRLTKTKNGKEEDAMTGQISGTHESMFSYGNSYFGTNKKFSGTYGNLGPFQSTNIRSTLENPTSLGSSTGMLYDLYIAKSCTVPGSCACEPDQCACPDCTEHGKYKHSNLSVKQQFEEFPFPLNSITPSHSHTNITDHTVNQISNPLVKPYGKVELQPTIPPFEQTFLNMLKSGISNQGLSSESISPTTDIEECYCEEDKCCCFNCAQHGIINGVRISDGVCVSTGSSIPFEIQLASSQYPLMRDPPTSKESSPESAVSSAQSELVHEGGELPRLYNRYQSPELSDLLDANQIQLPDRDMWLATNHPLVQHQSARSNNDGLLYLNKADISGVDANNTQHQKRDAGFNYPSINPSSPMTEFGAERDEDIFPETGLLES